MVFLFSLAVAVKIFHLQWVQGDKWRQMAQEKTINFQKVKATRGNIYSDNGNLLATSLPFYRLAIDPSVSENKLYKQGIDSLAYLLANHYQDRTPEEYKRKINNARQEKKKYLMLNSRMINYQTKKLMETWPILRAGRYKGGVIFERTDRRFNPFAALGTRTIGYLNQQSKGVVGLEASFNRQLAGKDGQALFQRMAGGGWKPLNDGSEVPPEQGWDIQTTIDINLQDVAQDALYRAVSEHQANYGCVVVMEVATGEIKAMANLGKLKNGGYAETYNYVVGQQGRTDPGSTFKLPSIIALLEETQIEPTDSIDTGNGTFRYNGAVMNDSRPGGYGKITVQEAFEHSSNVAFVMMMRDHFRGKSQRYIEYLDAFGLTRPLGFQMLGEAEPYIKRPQDKTWSGITLPWMAVGYESKMSPLHILAFYNAVANNGKMIQPIIVKEARITDNAEEQYQARVINQKICSDRTLRIVRKMLEGVVERGTAKNIRNNDYKIAGKTGTSQKLKNGRYSREYYTSFAGYFPADKPKYSCIVVIDSPQGYKQYGSDVAAPVFKEIADKVYARDIEMHKLLTSEPVIDENLVFPMVKAGHFDDLRYLCNQMGISNHGRESEEWVMANVSDNSIRWKNKPYKPDQIPDVLGMTLKDALYILENKGLKVNYRGRGRVVSQSQTPGTHILQGSTIEVVLD
jgi:cell division protein FtsI (penicillin-binding protein 3)